MATDITPGLGHGLLFTQTGVGSGPGYDMIDLVRAISVGRQEGPISSGSYKVTQRGAGANMSVDIAAHVGNGALVQGDSITHQGCYTIPAHVTLINEAITAAHATLPRLDQVVLEALDDTLAGGGNNKARVRVIDGTPTSGATLDNRSGAAALPPSAMRLADVLVGAADSGITNAEIRDRRPGAPCIIATEESRTNTAFGLMATADQVDVVLPTDGAIMVMARGKVKSSVSAAGAIAFFLNGNQLKNGPNSAVSQQSWSGTAYGTYVTSDRQSDLADLWVSAGVDNADATTGQSLGGVIPIFAAAGTYTVSMQTKSTSGSVTVKERKLLAWVHPGCAAGIS